MNSNYVGFCDGRSVKLFDGDERAKAASRAISCNADKAILCSLALESALDIDAMDLKDREPETMRECVMNAASRMMFEVWRDLYDVQEQVLSAKFCS